MPKTNVLGLGCGDESLQLIARTKYPPQETLQKAQAILGKLSPDERLEVLNQILEANAKKL